MYSVKPYASGKVFHICGKRVSPKLLIFKEFPSLATIVEAVKKEFAGIPDGRIQVHGDEDRVIVAPLLDEEVGTDQVPEVADSSHSYLFVKNNVLQNGVKFPKANPTIRELLTAVRRRNKVGYPESGIIVRSNPKDGVGTVAEVSGVSSLVFN